MKRVKATFVVADAVEKSYFATCAMSKGGELESYEEKAVPKDKGITEEHSFDELTDAAVEFANGVWLTAKGFFGMSKWAAIVVFQGLRWLWTRGAGMKKDKKNGKKEQKSKGV